jgi:hypothetical protein
MRSRDNLMDTPLSTRRTGLGFRPWYACPALTLLLALALVFWLTGCTVDVQTPPTPPCCPTDGPTPTATPYRAPWRLGRG